MYFANYGTWFCCDVYIYPGGIFDLGDVHVVDRSVACTSFWHVGRSFGYAHLGVDVSTIVLSQRAVVWRVDDQLVPLPVISRLPCGATHDSSTDLSPVRRGLAMFPPSAQLALPSNSLAENMGFWYVERSAMISRFF